MDDITPLLSEERANEAGGLWATKQYGDFKEGDRLRAPDYVTGSIEVRHLRSIYKLSFLDIQRVSRFTREVDIVIEHEASGDESDDSGGSQSGTKRGKKEENKAQLHVFLTRKKGKPRMADLEETAYMLQLDVGTDGCICFGKSFGDFDQGMLNVPDPTGFKGVVIAKRRMDLPVTEEPIVYAYAKIVPKRRPVVPTEVLLGLADDKDRVSRYIKATGSLKTDKQLLKEARKYTRTARKAWEALCIPEDEEIDVEGFKRAFDELNLVILEARAMRLFGICDLDRSGRIGISELEVALMINDIVPTTSYLTPLDSLYTFDLDGDGDISWVEFKEASEVITAGSISEGQAKELFEKVDSNNSGVIDYEEFKQAWIEMVNLRREMQVRGLKPAFGPMAKTRNKRMLLKAVEDEDKAIMETFQTVRDRVDNVRKKARLLRDEKRRQRASRGGKLSLRDANEDATRKRQRRLMIKREQAARSRQRVEQKVKENELQQQLRAKKERDTVQIKKKIAQNEKERIAGIRARREDQLWLSRLNLRQVPPEFYEGREWRMRLVDLVLLDVQGNRLTELPDSFISQMVSLRKLCLSKNRLTLVPDEHLANLGQLQILELSRNELRSLPSSVGNLTKLQHLNISRNEIEHLPEEFGLLHALQSLSAHSNGLQDLPTSVGGLVSLKLCDLSGNRLEVLPNDFSYATAITSLDISRNCLQYLPLDFGHLFSLKALNLSCNRLASLPTSVSTLKSLQILKLGENVVVEMTAAWGGMSSLIQLEAQANRIARVPPEIGEWLQLQRLDLRRNLIEELPPEIGLLTTLHELDLRWNHLLKIPDEMGALVGLNRLNISHNRLAHRLTEHMGLLTSLTHLDISRNAISHLPPSLGGLEDLRTLDVSKNTLSTLPKNFSFLTSLVEIDLSCNRFKEFPKILCDLAALRRLDMTSNVLCRLPREIVALTRLTRLQLKHNLLKSLPLEVVELEKHVKDLSVKQNPLSVLPSKWHAHFGPKEEASAPPGYTHGEVYEWLRAQRLFHDQATEEWKQKAGLYLTARASAKEYIDGVQARMGEDAWRPYLEPHVLRFFFRAKRMGMPDTFHEITPQEMQEREEVAASLVAERAHQKMLCEKDFEERLRRSEIIYAHDSSRKLAISTEHRSQLQRIHLVQFAERGLM